MKSFGLCAFALMFVSFASNGQQSKSGTAPRVTKGEPPTVTMNARGCPLLKLTVQQQAAVSRFQQTHPLFDMYDFTPGDYSDGSCLETSQQWKLNNNEKTVAQYPFALWEDFNHDGYLDLVVFFVSKKPAITHKWEMNGQFSYTYEHDWLVVVFNGSQDGGFSPVIVGKARWARALDGVIYYQGRHRIDYWFKSCGGSFHWTGTGYQSTAWKCED